MTIQELYYDAKFSSIVYFLNERGFSSFDNLQSFDFDELFFVPGVSADIIEEIYIVLRLRKSKHLIKKNCLSNGKPKYFQSLRSSKQARCKTMNCSRQLQNAPTPSIGLRKR